MKFSAFTAHLPLKVLEFFKVLNLACSVLWKYCIFENNFCKYRQLHAKTLISICPTMFFHRVQHHWTKTLKLQSSHLNFACILPRFCHAKPLQSTEHTARYHPVSIFCTFCFEKTMHSKIDTSFWWEPASFKVHCMLNPILTRNPSLSKTNVRKTL